MMAVRHFCDRCDQVVPVPSQMRTVTISEEDRHGNVDDDNSKCFSLCRGCWRVVRDALNPPPLQLRNVGDS